MCPSCYVLGWLLLRAVNESATHCWQSADLEHQGKLHASIEMEHGASVVETAAAAKARSSAKLSLWAPGQIHRLLLRRRILHHHQVVLSCFFKLRGYHDLVLLGSDPQELEVVLWVKFLDD